MGYSDTIYRRLQVFFRHPDVGSGPMRATTMLGTYFDDTALKGEIRGRMNRAAIGFADVLDSDIARAEIGAGTRFGVLVATIVKRSCLERKNDRCSNTAGAYTKRMRTLVADGAYGHDSLARLIQIVAPGVPDVILSTDIRQLLPTTAQRQQLRDRVNRDYAKFLMVPTVTRDYERIVSKAQRRVLIRLHR